VADFTEIRTLSTSPLSLAISSFSPGINTRYRMRPHVQIFPPERIIFGLNSGFCGLFQGIFQETIVIGSTPKWLKKELVAV